MQRLLPDRLNPIADGSYHHYRLEISFYNEAIEQEPPEGETCLDRLIETLAEALCAREAMLRPKYNWRAFTEDEVCFLQLAGRPIRCVTLGGRKFPAVIYDGEKRVGFLVVITLNTAED